MVDLRMLRTGASRLVIAGVLTGALLAGCKPNTQQQAAAPSAAPSPLAAIPLADSGTAPVAPAPAASALPAAPPARVGRLANRTDYYAFADQAHAMNSGFGDAPPDYTFDYGDGERPWVWRGDDQSMRVAEPLPDGGDRYYYYEPGSDAPYLVRDPEYSYGYQNGVLVVIYDRSGRALPPDALDRRADVAGRFLARARAIHRASLERQREAVARANWEARRSRIDADRAQWAAAQAADQDWNAYHAAHEQDDRARWDAERYRREAEAARFDQSINDNQAAQRDWQAAQRAQGRAAANGQAPAPPPAKPSGPFGFGPKPPPAPTAPPSAPPPVVTPPPHAPAAGPGAPPHGDRHGPGPMSGAPNSGPSSAQPRPTFDHRPGGPGPGAPQGHAEPPAPPHQAPTGVQHPPVAPVAPHREPPRVNPPVAPTQPPRVPPVAPVVPRREPPRVSPPVTPPQPPHAQPVAPHRESPRVNPVIAPPPRAPLAPPAAPRREPPHLNPQIAPPRPPPSAPAAPHIVAPPAAHVVKPPAPTPPEKKPEHKHDRPGSDEPPGAH